MYLRSVGPGLHFDLPHLRYVVGFEDDSEEAAGVPVGVGLAVGRVLRLRSRESFSLQLAGLCGSRSDIHFRQHQQLLLDRGHRCVLVRLHSQVQSKTRGQPGVVVSPGQVRELHASLTRFRQRFPGASWVISPIFNVIFFPLVILIFIKHNIYKKKKVRLLHYLMVFGLGFRFLIV